MTIIWLLQTKQLQTLSTLAFADFAQWLTQTDWPIVTVFALLL
jgi:hypothetical protein